ncbi:hypothetical protein [Nodularia chucula]|uniref:hypothetical protein n=1 Tax=Nodularia chucula TaxID=3093667 RepID=UPI0039C5AE8A
MMDITTNLKLSKASLDTKEKMREIAYSMDLLIPGLYVWLPRLIIRVGGSVPDDNPYKYPGKIHSSTGIAVVLPGYRIWTTYQGTYDPQQTPNTGATEV